jgi:hypothetical protein
MLRTFAILIQFFSLLMFTSVAIASDGNVGQIVFVSGDVQLHATEGQHPVKVGDAIQQGQELITKAGGYVYIKTSDNGFISLRPNSAVQFDVYQYSPDNPKNSKLKISLKYGVMRSISGIGAQSARDKYRLNTPVAAIGIRGTDFTVYATDEVTRATVTYGGIVMSGFNDNCTPGGTGPCKGSQIAELFAQQAGMLLQFRRGESHPVLLDHQSIHLAPDSMAPPLPNETPAKKAVESQSNAADLAGDQAITVKQGTALQDTLNQSQPTVPVPPVVVLPPPVVTPPAQQIFWGRWLQLANETGTTDSQLLTLVKDGKQLLGMNGIFGLVRDPSTDMALPSSGVFSFKLQAHESYILNDIDKTTVAANIENPALSINFNQQRFDTSFRVTTDLDKVDVIAHGSVLKDGSMISDQIGSTASILGGLANGGQQAGFLFQQKIDPNRSAVGATYWTH